MFALNLGLSKCGLKSERTGRFSHCPKWVPKTIMEYYFAHGNDKIMKVFNKLQARKTPCP